MFFSSMLSKKPIEFADTLVDKIVRQFPPSSEMKLSKNGAKRRLESIVEHIMADLEVFQKENKLGWIGKARLGNAFRWKLLEYGYSKQFVETLTRVVVTHITVQ